VPLYILDEPTSGLDPLMEKTFQDEIRDLKKQGKTVLLSSHILSEAEALCDRATIIREGKTVGVYELRELKANHENLEKIFLSKYEGEKSE
jgi:ABC-2 type transport system ATP-binding protein